MNEQINTGKIFENNFKKSIPDYCVYHRLSDSTGNFSGGTNLRFSAKQPFDAFVFDTLARIFYALELKTTKNNMFSFEDINTKETQPSKMIHKHQILSLKDFSNYNHTYSGFIFNFRDEENGTECTYYQDVNDFIDMTKQLGKKSFNQKDILKYNHIVINGKKKTTKWYWNLDEFFRKLGEKNGSK